MSRTARLVMSSMALALSATACMAEVVDEDGEELGSDSQAINDGKLVGEADNAFAPYSSIVQFSIARGPKCTATKILDIPQSDDTVISRFITAAHCLNKATYAPEAPVEITAEARGIDFGLPLRIYDTKLARIDPHPFYMSTFAQNAGGPSHSAYRTWVDVGVFDVFDTVDEKISAIPALPVPNTPVGDGVPGEGIGYGADDASDNGGEKQRAYFETIGTTEYRAARGTAITNEQIAGEWTLNLITNGTRGEKGNGGDSGGPFIMNKSVMGVFSGGYAFHPFSFFARTQIVSDWVLNPDPLSVAAGSKGYLWNVKSDKCMGTDGDEVDNKAWQLFCQGNLTSQKWTLATNGTTTSGYFMLKNLNNLCLLPLTINDNAQLAMRTCNTATTSYGWKFIPRAGNTYALQNRVSGKCITNGGSTSYVTYLKQAPCSSTDDAQRFIFSR